MSAYSVSVQEVSLAAATTETLWQIVAPSDERIEVVEYGISFEGVTAANEPGNVDLLRQTTAGTASAATVVQLDPDGGAFGGSAQDTFTAEPTAGDVLIRHLITPNASTVIHSMQPDARPVVAKSGRIALRATFADVVDCSVYVLFRTL